MGDCLDCTGFRYLGFRLEYYIVGFFLWRQPANVGANTGTNGSTDSIHVVADEKTTLPKEFDCDRFHSTTTAARMFIATGTNSQEKQDVQKENALNTRQDRSGTFVMQSLMQITPTDAGF